MYAIPENILKMLRDGGITEGESLMAIAKVILAERKHCAKIAKESALAYGSFPAEDVANEIAEDVMRGSVLSD